MKRLIDDKTAAQIRQLVDSARKVAIVCHMTPDGDAMGSSLCLWHVLRKQHKSVVVITPDAPAQNLMFLPGANNIIIASYTADKAQQALSVADLVVCLDFNDLKRIGRLADMIEGVAARRIVIDHHIGPEIDADVVVSHPEVSSTCALLYHVMRALGWTELVDKDAAECCCAGMMTDTGNFSYNSNDPDLYTILADLMRTGIDKDAIYTRIFNTNTESRVRLMGYAQYAKMQLMYDHGAALITLSRRDLDEFDYVRGDTESLVNVPLSIPGIVYSIFLREDEPDYVKVSMRSKGAFSVKDICMSHFGGGGHCNASGGEIRASLDEAVDKVLEILPQYDGAVIKSMLNQS